MICYGWVIHFFQWNFVLVEISKFIKKEAPIVEQKLHGPFILSIFMATFKVFGPTRLYYSFQRKLLSFNMTIIPLFPDLQFLYTCFSSAHCLLNGTVRLCQKCPRSVLCNQQIFLKVYKISVVPDPKCNWPSELTKPVDTMQDKKLPLPICSCFSILGAERGERECPLSHGIIWFWSLDGQLLIRVGNCNKFTIFMQKSAHERPYFNSYLHQDPAVVAW